MPRYLQYIQIPHYTQTLQTLKLENEDSLKD